MKKRVIVISLVLLLCCIYTISAAEGFNESRVSTWKNDFDKFNQLSPETKNKAWNDASTTSIEKIRFLKDYLVKYNVIADISGLDDKSLVWGNGGIFGNSLAYFDFTKLDPKIKKISFVKENGNGRFIFEFESGKIQLDKGYFNGKDQIIVNKNSGSDVFSWNQEGEFSFINNEIKIKDSATFVNNGRTFSVYTANKKGEVSVKLDSDGNYEVRGFSKIDSVTASIFRTTKPDEAFKVFFDNKDHGSQGTYVQVDGNNLLKMSGNEISAKLNSWFKNVELKGDKVSVWDGENQILLNNGKAMLPRNFYKSEHDIENLKIGDMKAGEYFSLSNGKIYYSLDGVNRLIVGQTDVSLRGKGRLDLIEFQSSVSKEDLDAIKSKIKREDFPSDEAYQRAIENEINLGKADWSLSATPTERRILGRIVSNKMNEMISGSDLAETITRGYNQMDIATANSFNDFTRNLLSNPAVSLGTETLINIPEVREFVNNLGISDSLTIDSEQARNSRLLITENAEKIFPYLPDRIPVPETIRNIFGIQSNEVPKDVFMALVVLSNNQAEYEAIGKFIESSSVSRGSGITLSVNGKQEGIITDSNGQQFITSPKILNSVRTALTYFVPEYLKGYRGFSKKGFEAEIQNKGAEIQQKLGR